MLGYYRLLSSGGAIVHFYCSELIGYLSSSPSALSAANEREDQYKVLQVKNKRWVIHHTEKLLVQFYEPWTKEMENIVSGFNSQVSKKCTFQLIITTYFTSLYPLLSLPAVPVVILILLGTDCHQDLRLIKIF